MAGNNADAGVCAHAPHMRAGSHAIGPHTGAHADRADLHAGGSAGLRQGDTGSDKARSKNDCG
jgi:hypothetical protein